MMSTMASGGTMEGGGANYCLSKKKNATQSSTFTLIQK